MADRESVAVRSVRRPARSCRPDHHGPDRLPHRPEAGNSEARRCRTWNRAFRSHSGASSEAHRSVVLPQPDARENSCRRVAHPDSRPSSDAVGQFGDTADAEIECKLAPGASLTHLLAAVIAGGTTDESGSAARVQECIPLGAFHRPPP